MRRVDADLLFFVIVLVYKPLQRISRLNCSIHGINETFAMSKLHYWTQCAS